MPFFFSIFFYNRHCQTANRERDRGAYDVYIIMFEVGKRGKGSVLLIDVNEEKKGKKREKEGKKREKNVNE